MRQVTTSVGRFVRWSLLACTLLGVAAMHTLGHLDSGHGHASSSTGMVIVAQIVDADHCLDGSCLTHHRRHEHDSTAWSVCLAVVTGFAAALLLAWLLLNGLARTAPGRATAVRSGSWSSRGPPARPAGLTLATTSVLRT